LRNIFEEKLVKHLLPKNFLMLNPNSFVTKLVFKILSFKLQKKQHGRQKLEKWL